MMKRDIVWGSFNLLCGMVIAFGLLSAFHGNSWKPEVITEVIYRYPNTPPVENFTDPITFDQALALLGGMRASHIQVQNWTFETDPGFGIADKELQTKMVHWYDQLIDFTWREHQK